MPGRTGRRKLPTAVKVAHGERRQERLNPREPQPTPGAPPKPALGKVAGEEWDRLAGLCMSMKVLTVADGPALAAVCVAYEDMTAARGALVEGGRFYSTVNEDTGARMMRAHPALISASESWKRYVCGLGLFGLSPAARAKVSAAPSQDAQDDVELWLIRGGKEK